MKMPWQPLDAVKLGAEFQKKTKILVDESLGVEVASYLRDEGYNAVFAGDVGLSGRSDEEVLAYAWQDRRILWTHDRDFLNDERFPEHRNPGVLVLPGGGGDSQALGTSIGVALSIFGSGPTVWQKTKCVVSPTGEMSIRGRNPQTGRMETIRFRASKGRAEMWED
jgi:predicted nuclease of predicted toxin-antitoxin system